jgi:hypothetical protein
VIKKLKKLSKRKRLAIVQSIPLNMQARVIKELHILKSTQSCLYSVETTYGINSVIPKIMTFVKNTETGQFLIECRFSRPLSMGLLFSGLCRGSLDCWVQWAGDDCADMTYYNPGSPKLPVIHRYDCARTKFNPLTGRVIRKVPVPVCK